MKNEASKLNPTQASPRRETGIPRRIGVDEKLISLTEATKRLLRVDGRKPHVCTIWRWCSKGLRGVFLEYVRVGRNIRTTHEALLSMTALILLKNSLEVSR